MTVVSRKGPDAFRTISEASAELGVPQHVLRFWETKFAFIQPVKRAGGRRFYRPADLDVLRGVRTLLHDEGYTIKGVQRLHKEGGLKRLTSAVADGPARRAVNLADDEAPGGEEETVDVVSHAELDPRELLAAAAAPASARVERPSRQVLDPPARDRLTAVLHDLETARQAIGALLERRRPD